MPRPSHLCKDKQWTTDLDVQLIQAVHSHNAIWDSSATDYHNPLAKYMAWQAIETSTGIECGVVKKRWTTLRDSFTKAFRRLQAAKRSGSGSRKVKYKYYYDMLFLAPTLRQTIELNSPSDLEDGDISDPDSPLTILYPEQSNEEPSSNCANSDNESTGNGADQDCPDSPETPAASPSPTPNQRPQRKKKEPSSVSPPEAPPLKKRGRPPLITRISTTSSTPLKPGLQEALAKAAASSSLASTSKQTPLSKEDALCEAAGRLVAEGLKDLPKSAVKKKIAQIMNMLASADS